MTCVGEELYKKIETFVFFDLETTGLIKGTKMPKVTELSMVATSRNSIKCDKRNKLALPRIIHKLTIPICPMQPIDPQASFASNLWNDLLEEMRPFDETTYDIIIQFINRLPGIICFVAHNGNRFDYPVFLSELNGIKKIFPDRILCVDTLPAFQEFFSDVPVPPISLLPVQILPEGRDEVDEEELLKLKSQESDSSLDDQWNEALCAVVDNFDKVQTNENGKDVLDAMTSDKNQQTASTPSGPTTPKSSPTKSMQAINETTPENQIIRTACTSTSTSPLKILNSVRKQLNYGDSKPKNFKLSTVYLHMIGCEAQDLHCAEGDCITMLRCVCQIGPSFTEWADMNAISLNHFKK